MRFFAGLVLAASSCAWINASAQQLVALPKTIHDILAVLDQYKPDPSEQNRARELVKREPPHAAGDHELAKFYQDRSIAARTLGMTGKALEDARKAAATVRPGTEEEMSILVDLTDAEIFAGNLLNARNARRAQARRAPGAGSRVVGNAFVAVLSVQMGDIAEAETAMAEAERGLSGIGWSVWSTRGDDFIGLMERARAYVHYGRGRLEEAVRSARLGIQASDRAAEFFTKRPDVNNARWPHLRSMLLETELAGYLLLQGRLSEAEWQGRNVLRRILEFRGKSGEASVALSQLGHIIYAQGRFNEAKLLARVTREILQASGAEPSSRGHIDAMKQEAAALVALGQFSQALDRFQAMRQVLAGDAALREVLSGGSSTEALALIKMERSAEAVLMLRPLVKEASSRLGRNHVTVGEYRGLLGMGLAGTRDRAGALAEFSEAIPILLDAAEVSSASPAQMLRVGTIVEAYIALLSELQAEGLKGADGREPAEEAFHLADALRGRTLQVALAEAAARSAASTPELGELIRRNQDLRHEISILYEFVNNQFSAPPDQQLPKVVADMHKRIDAIGQERQQTTSAIQNSFPAYANLIQPKPATVDEARKALAPAEALLSVLVTPRATFVWAIRKSGPIAFTASRLGGKDVNELVGSLRKSLDPGDVSVFGMPPLDLAAGYRLYAELLAPVETGWRDAKTLLVVANGALGQLPLGLLPMHPVRLAPDKEVPFSELKSVPWLAKRIAMAQLPSVSSLITLRTQSAPKLDRTPFIGFGDPRFSRTQVAQVQATRGVRLRNLSVPRAPQEQTETQLSSGQVTQSEAKPAEWVVYEKLAPLPDTRDEILAIAQALKADLKNAVFLGADASKKTVKSLDLSRQRVIAFATHGLIPGDLPNLTQPALALAAPDDPKESGLLTLDDVLGLKLDADWVVLSACNTAAGDGAGAEAISGLGRGFFYAGARALLVTHWPVETVSARKLVTSIFDRYSADATLTRAEALRQSMLSLIDEVQTDASSGRALFSYAHPIFWAPYALVGDSAR
jgi:CHAT domain-containing protein